MRSLACPEVGVRCLGIPSHCFDKSPTANRGPETMQSLGFKESDELLPTQHRCLVMHVTDWPKKKRGDASMHWSSPAQTDMGGGGGWLMSGSMAIISWRWFWRWFWHWPHLILPCFRVASGRKWPGNVNMEFMDQVTGSSLWIRSPARVGFCKSKLIHGPWAVGRERTLAVTVLF